MAGPRDDLRIPQSATEQVRRPLARRAAITTILTVAALGSCSDADQQRTSTSSKATNPAPPSSVTATSAVTTTTSSTTSKAATGNTSSPTDIATTDVSTTDVSTTDSATTESVAEPDPGPPPEGQSIGYLRGVAAADGEITVDLAQLLTGSAAVRAAIEDGHLSDPVAGLPDNRYLRNRSTALRQLRVAPDVVVTRLPESGAGQPVPTNLGDFALRLLELADDSGAGRQTPNTRSTTNTQSTRNTASTTSTTVIDTAGTSAAITVTIVVTDGVVTRIDEYLRP